MTVYKGYMKIVKRNLGLILMYVVIFAGITVLFQQFSSADPAGSYQAESVRIAVVRKKQIIKMLPKIYPRRKSK